MNSKAQISIEFFIFVGLAFLIAIAFALASLDQLKDFRIQKEDETVKDLALKLQRELLIAAAVEDGYVRVFEVPNKIDGIGYAITTKNSTITVQSKNSLYTVSIPQAVGNITKGVITINKTESAIYVNSKSSSFSNSNICQNAHTNDLCSGLDIVYGAGYQAACCSEHGFCC